MTLEKYLMDELCINSNELHRFAITAPHRYKKYKIPKRNNRGFRDIAQPSKRVKYFQRLIIEYLEPKLSIHQAATAYVKGLGIKDNALIHSRNKYLLKMDFEDFFPSITPSLFFLVCHSLGIVFDEQEQKLISYFLFYKLRANSPLRLSIGAPSSPLISNFVMSLFDQAISEHCSTHKISYSRYADDITFSTAIQGKTYDIPDIVVTALKQTTFNFIKVNTDKTVFSSKAANRHITGITITNDDKLSLGRERKRLISAMLHHFKHGKLEKEKIHNLKGLISFSNYIEPSFIISMRKKYGDEIFNKLNNFM